MLRIAYKDYKSFLAAHYRIVQKLAIELYEVKMNYARKLCLFLKMEHINTILKIA